MTLGRQISVDRSCVRFQVWENYEQVQFLVWEDEFQGVLNATFSAGVWEAVIKGHNLVVRRVR